jgi:ABC-type transporter Mla MlaB component
MLQMFSSIEDGRVVLRLGGELDGEGAAAVARLIGQSMGDFSLDFTDVNRVEQSGFAVLAQAIRRCPYKLVLRGLKEGPGLRQEPISYK